MKSCISDKRKYLIERLNFLREKANLTARDLSQRLNHSIAYIAKFENGDFSIPAETLLAAIEICGGRPDNFFWDDITRFESQKNFLNKFDSLSDEAKEVILTLMDTLS